MCIRDREAFDWLGLPFDESPREGGDFGPYRQSQRREIYKEHVHRLLGRGAAYIAFDTPEELDAKRKEVPKDVYKRQVLPHQWAGTKPMK